MDSGPWAFFVPARSDFLSQFDLRSSELDLTGDRHGAGEVRVRRAVNQEEEIC
jgi:hypothetical protein